MAALSARMRLLVLLVAIFLGASGRAQSQPQNVGPTAPDAARVAFVVNALTGDEMLSVATAFAASGHPGVLLFDGPKAGPANRRFLDAFQPARVVAIGHPPAEAKPGTTLPVTSVRPCELWRALFPTAERVVVVPSKPQRLRLQAAALAGALRAPLFELRDAPSELAELRFCLERWQTRELFWLGPSAPTDPPLEGVTIRAVPDEDSALTATVQAQARRGRIETLVLANPTDLMMSPLAPWIAAKHDGVLLLTDGTDATAVVRTALERPGFERVENLIVVGSPSAIPPERRANPIVGRDEFIEMEPFTPASREPFTLATGRLFHADPGVVALQIARARLLPAAGTPRRALVASNPGNSLPLLETCSHVSAQELHNRGYEVTGLFGNAVTLGRLRRELPGHDLVLWEGHHNTFINDWQFPSWDEPLPPSFVFLQSCLTLTEEKVTPLFTRGSVAVLGSSSRIYSATGGAFSVAYLDAVLYDGQTLGGALRQAKNFLSAYSQLKEKRLEHVRLSGANLRSAWAFTLWGDPTLRLPAPHVPQAANRSVRHTVKGNTITITIPEAVPETPVTAQYQVPFRPNARLAGLVRPGDNGKVLVPFVFAEVPLPHAPNGATPRLVTRLGDSQWVFAWDARRRVGFLLATPKAVGEQIMKFQVEWDPTLTTKSDGH